MGKGEGRDRERRWREGFGMVFPMALVPQGLSLALTKGREEGWREKIFEFSSKKCRVLCIFFIAINYSWPETGTRVFNRDIKRVQLPQSPLVNSHPGYNGMM